MRVRALQVSGAFLLGAAAAVSALCPAEAREPSYVEALTADLNAVFWDSNALEFRRVPALPVSMQQPDQPLDVTPAPTVFTPPEQPLDFGPSLGGSQRYSFDFEPQVQEASFSRVINGGTGNLLGAPDPLSALQQDGDSTLNAQQRSPVSLDPHIRGYRIGQIYTQADGAFYFPVRNDLDSALSKIDRSLIKDTIIVPGPYGLRYGPGFSYIDVQTFSTRDIARFANGYETHGRTGFDYRTNGGQVYGRETIWGGSSDWGFIFSYGGRNGGDYQAGNGLRIPASYEVQNFNLQLGFDLTPDSWIEFRGARLDQTNTEYAGQFFDVNFLVSDAVTVNYVNEAPLVGSRLRADAWWNNTRFAGDTRNTSKQTFNVINRVDAALQVLLPGALLTGDTSGDLMSTGAREVLSFGNQQDGDMQVDVGVDARYLTQSTIENFTIRDGAGVDLVPPFFTNQPLSSMTDVGGYLDITLPWVQSFTTTMGYRVDYVHTDAEASQLRANTQLLGAPGSLSQNDMLHSFYLMNDLQTTEYLGLRFGAGHAERVPTLTDRYADGIFLGIIQSGFSRIIGDPNLLKEGLWQADVGLRADYDVARGNVDLFYSWIDNYVTYAAQTPNDPTGAQLLRMINTTSATLAGLNARVEADWTSQATSYATLMYVKGDDLGIGQPLAQIFPLDTRAGLRLNSDDEENTWGLDTGLRMVATQNRVANVRTLGGVGLTQLEQRTGGFTTAYLRGYYNYSRNLHFVGGVENLFNRTYLDHLALRFPAQAVGSIPATSVFSPGITPYVGIEWTF